MIPSVRKQYNQTYTAEKYKALIDDIEQTAQFKLPFRVAETPVFVDAMLFSKLISAGSEIIRFIDHKDFKQITERAIPNVCYVPNEDEKSLFIALDFAVCKDDTGNYSPQLIEMQGFPSLFAYQHFLALNFRKHFDIPSTLNHLLNGMTNDEYLACLKNSILGSHEPQHVILLEIEPLKQATAVDFILTEQFAGVKAVCISEVIRENKKLFYLRQGVKTEIKRIYNRVIFDELLKRPDLDCAFSLTDDVDIEWAGHPNWFFRISKYTMPLLKSDFIPPCYFLDQIANIPSDLKNYVLKPLFSFSGSGVLFHVTPNDIDQIPFEERHNYLLQRKVHYEPCIQTPDGQVKCEIRLLYIYNTNKQSYELILNLVRLSHGEMIGTKYNKDKTWVGGTVGFFES